MQRFRSTDTATTSKNYRFILSERLDFHMVDNLPVPSHAFPMRMLTSLSVDKILLLRYINYSNNFRGLPFNEKIL